MQSRGSICILETENPVRSNSRKLEILFRVRFADAVRVLGVFERHRSPLSPCVGRASVRGGAILSPDSWRLEPKVISEKFRSESGAGLP